MKSRATDNADDGDARVSVRVYERRFTWWAQIDGTFSAGGALKTRDGRERAIRKAICEYKRALACRKARDGEAAAAEVVIRDAAS